MLHGVDPTFLAMAIAVAVALAEAALLRWCGRVYYRLGIPLYRCSLQAAVAVDRLPEADRIAHVGRQSFGVSFSFIQLTPTTFGFHERTSTSHPTFYFPLMRGYLTLHPGTGSVVCTGRLNLFSIAVVSAVFTGVPLVPSLFTGMWAITLAVFYTLQARGFRRATRAACSAWEQADHAHARVGPNPGMQRTRYARR